LTLEIVRWADARTGKDFSYPPGSADAAESIRKPAITLARSRQDPREKRCDIAPVKGLLCDYRCGPGSSRLELLEAFQKPHLLTVGSKHQLA